MRHRRFTRSVLFALTLLTATAALVSAQSAPVTVRNVTVDVSGDLLIISGSGFGASPAVTIDGVPVTVLPGGSDTQVTVPLPASVKVNAGTYRLTVVDPARNAGDAFVVTSSGPRIAVAASTAIVSAPAAGVAAAATASTTDRASSSSSDPAASAIDPALEGSSNTSFGQLALNSLTSGLENAAFGQSSLRSTTTGVANTGAGSGALYFNTFGNYNTGAGAYALAFNTTGQFNTGVGHSAGSSMVAGNWNIYLGAAVEGALNDSNTTRIGIPYAVGAGQNRTFVSGIRGTNVAGGLPVLVDANGQLGNAPAGPTFTNGGGVGVGTSAPNAKLDVVAGTNDGLRISDGTATGVLFPSGLLGRSLAFGTQSNHPILFGTNNSFDRLTLAANGNVGIGTTSPVAKLEVNSATNSGMRFTDGTTVGVLFPSGLNGNSFAIGTQTNHPLIFGTGDSWGRLTIAANGNIGIGLLTPSQPLQAANGAYLSAGGVWTNASSRSLKDQILDLPASRALDAFARLQPVTFVYKAEPAQTHVGFIAEDVPELVATTDRRSLSAMDLVALVTKVVQIQRDQIADQEAQLSAAKTALAEQQTRLGEQQAALAEQSAALAELRARLSRLEAR
jgi:hypothetical protein